MDTKQLAFVGFTLAAPVPIAWVATGSILIALLLQPLVFAAAFAVIGSLLQRRADGIARLKALATTDALTGLGNKRAFDDHLEAEVARARRAGEDLSVVFLDIDHFKRVNDTWGHATGDAVLETVGRRLSSVLRRYDRAFRTGGEEFVVVAPGADRDTAQRIAERIRRFVSDIPFEVPEVGALSVTTSAGAATLADDEPAQKMVARADSHLYEAKRRGRNRVVSALSPTPDQGVVLPMPYNPRLVSGIHPRR